MDSSKNCCPFVTKLCAVTKLGDLTVLLILTANEHILTESWLQIVEVAITSVGMSVQDTALTMFIILPSSNECKAYLTLAPFTVVSAYI